MTTDESVTGSAAQKPLAYVAGPYTHPDPVLNTRAACAVADELVALGFAVIVPHLSLLWRAISPASVDEWYARDLDVLAHCDVIVRFPGASTGADREVVFAQQRGIPLYEWEPNTDDRRAILTGLCGVTA